MGTNDIIYEVEKSKTIKSNNIKEKWDINCKKCRGVGIDHYGNPCICRYS